MENLSFEETQSQIEKEKVSLLYITMPNCSVCHSVKPRIEKTFENIDLPMFALDAYEAPKVAGTFQVMTAPAVLVFYQGEEVHRQARFINFKQLDELVRNYLEMTEPTNYTDLFNN